MFGLSENLSIPEIAWSWSFETADWIGERLQPFGSREIGAVVPDGFDAYVAIKHPDVQHGMRLERLVGLSEILETHTEPSDGP